MKKLIFGLIATLLAFGTIQAQDVKKLKKEATKSLAAFNLDKENKEKIQAAVDNAKTLAGMDLPAEEAADAYLVIGEVYKTIANEINTSKTLGINTAEKMPEVKFPELKAYQAYADALKSASKKYHSKEALKGIREVQNFMSYRGVDYYKTGDYGAAYNGFKYMIEAHDLLKENSAASALDDPESLANQQYLLGLAAYNAKKTDEAKKYLMMLYDNDTKEPVVYEYLYKIGSEGDDGAEKAYKFLEEGRKKFPDEIGLLFAEINHFLKLGQSEKLIEKIKQAIAAEPSNTSLYNVLGNTYDKLYQNAVKEGNQQEADQHFKDAFDQFKKSFELDPKSSVAIYSIGQLYYNKAALKTQDLQKYASDYSKEGMKKYEEAREVVFEQFDKALPYFQMSEALDPNDQNTLVALKEIYAKKDDLPTSNIFKERLEKVQAGEKVGSSHHKAKDVDIKTALSQM